mmetsp:Transcript_14215/g.45576  ORF Transcript_14215/g.45576 Transcript_14215/m.45576 type:complete len:333 (+) Transcript_14215:249-1247(+)
MVSFLAPFLTSTAATGRTSAAAATARGVKPAWFGRSSSAPFSSRSSTTETRPFLSPSSRPAAMWRGVLPSLSPTLMSTPGWSRSSCTTAASQRSAARCKGCVQLKGMASEGSAPPCKRARTRSMVASSPSQSATCRAVSSPSGLLVSQRALGSTFAARMARTRSALPHLHARWRVVSFSEVERVASAPSSRSVRARLGCLSVRATSSALRFSSISNKPPSTSAPPAVTRARAQATLSHSGASLCSTSCKGVYWSPSVELFTFAPAATRVEIDAARPPRAAWCRGAKPEPSTLLTVSAVGSPVLCKSALTASPDWSSAGAAGAEVAAEFRAAW